MGKRKRVDATSIEKTSFFGWSNESIRDIWRVIERFSNRPNQEHAHVPGTRSKMSRLRFFAVIRLNIALVCSSKGP
jgi:hypothetical protein